MKVRSFNSIEELNKFLTEDLGVPGLTEGVLPPEVLEEMLTGGAQFNVHMDDDSVYIEPTPSDASDPEVPTIAQSEMDNYIELSCNQIAFLVRQRDEARADAEGEYKDHVACHEQFEATLQQVHRQGYAEALAAGLFPNQPLETLPKMIQDSIYSAADMSISQITKIRANGTTKADVSTAKH
jgi:hypothetical protein